MIQCTTIVWILAVIGGGLGSRTAAPVATPSEIRLATRLQRDTVSFGEPLLLTCIIRNLTAELRRVPTFHPQPTPEHGQVGYLLCGPDGRCWHYAVGRHVLSGARRSPDYCYPVPPDDSFYWRRLLWWTNFLDGREPFKPKPGKYRLVTTLWQPVYLADTAVPPVQIADTLDFTLMADKTLELQLRRCWGYLREWFWRGSIRGSTPGATDAALAALRHTRDECDSGYIYLDYVIIHVQANTTGQTEQALSSARQFIRRHPMHPLAEELHFDMLLFHNNAHHKADADSLQRDLLLAYPRNLRGSMLSEGCDAWRSGIRLETER
jgi:hypothetical protein